MSDVSTRITRPKAYILSDADDNITATLELAAIDEVSLFLEGDACSDNAITLLQLLVRSPRFCDDFTVACGYDGNMSSACAVYQPELIKHARADLAREAAKAKRAEARERAKAAGTVEAATAAVASDSDNGGDADRFNVACADPQEADAPKRGRKRAKPDTSDKSDAAPSARRKRMTPPGDVMQQE